MQSYVTDKHVLNCWSVLCCVFGN